MSQKAPTAYTLHELRHAGVAALGERTEELAGRQTGAAPFPERSQPELRSRTEGATALASLVRDECA